MNTYICIANLTKDVELRTTPQGKSVANLNIAVNIGYGDKKETLFLQATAWEKTAESCAKYLSKGKKVAITGRLAEQKWTDKETGKERSKIILNISQVEFLSPKDESAPTMSSSTAQTMPEIEEEVFIPGEQEMF